jgi:hypothetical protein
MSFILPTLLSMSNLPHIILIFAQTSLQFVMVLWCCLKCELTDPAGGLRVLPLIISENLVHANLLLF